MKNYVFKIHPLRHYFLVRSLLPKNKIKLLDYGSGKGEFVGHLGLSNVEACGAEVNPESVTYAKKHYKKVKFRTIKVGEKLPLKDEGFDVVTMFHVLEHVDSEKDAIKESARVLKRGGTFFLASPYRGLFTFADTANLRFRFPLLHKISFILILGKEEYLRRFSETSKSKLYGDCSNNRDWHKHYTEKEIRKLLDKDFKIEKFYKFSLFHPFLLLIYNFTDYVLKKHASWATYLIYLDNKINAGEYSYNFLVMAKKK